MAPSELSNPGSQRMAWVVFDGAHRLPPLPMSQADARTHAKEINEAGRSGLIAVAVEVPLGCWAGHGSGWRVGFVAEPGGRMVAWAEIPDESPEVPEW